MAEDSFTGKERELSRALVPGRNTIPQILPPPQRIGASSLNQVHRQHCNISGFSETHKTRRCSCINQSTSHLQAPHSLQSCHRRSTFVAPPLDLLLRRHTPGTPGQGSSLRTFWVYKWITFVVVNHLCRLLVASNRLARLSGRQCIPPHDTQDHWRINLLTIMIMLTITSATVTWVTTRAVALKTLWW